MRNSIKKKKRQGNIVLYIGLLALPLLQFSIMYVGVNFKSILMAFQDYVIEDGIGHFQMKGFDNIIQAFKDVFGLSEASSGSLTIQMIINSFIAYSFSILVSTPCALFFSYYIVKKFVGWKFFRIVMFIPAILAGVITANVFEIICNGIIPELLGKINGVTSNDIEYIEYFFMQNEKTIIPSLLLYSFILGFTSNVLLYSGAMSGISEELFDAAKIDGATDFQEFIYIVFPGVWGTFSTFIVVGVSGFFTVDLGLYNIFAHNAPASVQTIGYYLHVNALSGAQSGGAGNALTKYPYMAALGVLFTLMVMPIVFSVRYLLHRFGPSEE